MFFVQNWSGIYLVIICVLTQMNCTSLYIFLQVHDFYLLDLVSLLFCNIYEYSSKIFQHRCKRFVLFCKNFAYQSKILQHRCKNFVLFCKNFAYQSKISQNQCKSIALFSKTFVLNHKIIVKDSIMLKNSNKIFTILDTVFLEEEKVFLWNSTTKWINLEVREFS